MMCEDRPITDEELWGVPVEDQPAADPDRNYFDEQQGITGKDEDHGK